MKRQPDEFSLYMFLTKWTPTLTVVIGAWWALFVFMNDQSSSRTTRLIEVQKPYLQRQLDLYFETAKVVGVLVTEDRHGDAARLAEKRFWALYWSELAMVEHYSVETGMKFFGDALKAYGRDPTPAQLKDLQERSLYLAFTIRKGVEVSWSTTGGPPGQLQRVDIGEPDFELVSKETK